MAFRDGRPIDGFLGVQPESGIKAFVDRLLGAEEAVDIAEALKAGDEAYDAGDLQGAAEIYASVLEEKRDEPGALAGLARCYLKSGDIERAEQTLGLVPPDKRANAAVAAVRAAIDLATKAKGAGDSNALEAKVAANPTHHQARIDLAMALAARGDKEAAVDQLLESFRRDRNWNEQAARKQLVQFFEAWAPRILRPSTAAGGCRRSCSPERTPDRSARRGTAGPLPPDPGSSAGGTVFPCAAPFCCRGLCCRSMYSSHAIWR